MAWLLIATDLPVGSELDDSPLAGSLRASTAATGWTFEARDDIAGTVMVDAATTLEPDALDHIARALATAPDIDVFFADGWVADRLRLRGAWSPTRVANDPADVDLVVARARQSSGALSDRLVVLAGTADDRIGHLPAVLTRRTEIARPDDDGRRFLETRRADPAPAGVSVVIPTAGSSGESGRPLVVAAIDAARRGGVEVEILLVIGDEFQGDVETLLADDVRVVRRPSGPWNFSASVNLGLLDARHDAVLLLNDDIEAIADGWLLPMVDHLRDPLVGAVGSLLLYPNRTVQHAGMVIDDALPLHCFAGMTTTDAADHHGLVGREVAAITGACLLARRRELLAVGGLNEALPFSFNDVDLCFKFLRRGQRVTLETSSPLIHHEGASREPVTEGWEWDRFVQRWGHVVDPWYHPGFVRPDDPDDRRRNADHLAPAEAPEPQPVRTARIRSRVHYARIHPVEVDRNAGVGSTP